MTVGSVSSRPTPQVSKPKIEQRAAKLDDRSSTLKEKATSLGDSGKPKAAEAVTERAAKIDTRSSNLAALAANGGKVPEGKKPDPEARVTKLNNIASKLDERATTLSTEGHEGAASKVSSNADKVQERASKIESSQKGGDEVQKEPPANVDLQA